MQISPPTHVVGDTNRSLECEQHFADPVRELVAQALTAGWTAQEAFLAIEEVIKDERAAYKEAPDPAHSEVF